MKPALFLLFLLSTHWSTAQYLPTVVDGHHWTVRQYQGMDNYVDYEYGLRCDSTVASATYLQIIRDDGQFLGLVREDTLAQTIYYRGVGDTTETLIIRYDLAVGDTFYISGVPVICEQVSTVDLYGATRKLIRFNLSQGFIEGVGNSFFGVHDFGQFQGVVGFDPNGAGCSVTSTSAEYAPQPVAVFPNPFGDYLTIYLPPATTVQFKFVDTVGRTILRGIAPGTTTIPTAGLPAGVYFICLSNGQVTKVVRH
ncbi:MAG: hypothetical protein DA408_02240 [Bacteroidetes bacterium]|nr:MAG: hypothetical protein C7N36_00925 [Bacteroidota bacterium]PTM14630.1 MAG: hypothetical protein DA408_02240 [Bacteroidota bacterium]